MPFSVFLKQGEVWILKIILTGQLSVIVLCFTQHFFCKVFEGLILCMSSRFLASVLTFQFFTCFLTTYFIQSRFDFFWQVQMVFSFGWLVWNFKEKALKSYQLCCDFPQKIQQKQMIFLQKYRTTDFPWKMRGNWFSLKIMEQMIFLGKYGLVIFLKKYSLVIFLQIQATTDSPWKMPNNWFSLKNTEQMIFLEKYTTTDFSSKIRSSDFHLKILSSDFPTKIHDN